MFSFFRRLIEALEESNRLQKTANELYAADLKLVEDGAYTNNLAYRGEIEDITRATDELVERMKTAEMQLKMLIKAPIETKRKKLEVAR
jgi:hypothetical protein